MKRSFSRGSAAMATALVVLTVFGLAQNGSARELPSGSSTYNGQTTTVRGNADGSRTRTTTDHRTGQTNTSNSRDDRVGGSSRNPDTGKTTSSYQNPDGSRTITVTDRNGRVISEGRPDNRTGGSCRNPETGKTTSSYLNLNGTHKITVRDVSGRLIDQRCEGQPKKLPVLVIQGRIAQPAPRCAPRAPACAPRSAPRLDPGCPSSWSPKGGVEVWF